ncbi:hypothetical protein DENSPDRAFT_861912 [Dentipellis sp. KUC8613]|nr:hypothetical protein DENSPDRAFT_861912 [Dentipellis sp. KUC8613]
MHNLFLGEFHHHVRHLWGLEDKGSAEPHMAEHDPERQNEEITKAVDAMKENKRSAMMKVRKGYIVSIAQYEPSRKLNVPVPSDKPVFEFSLAARPDATDTSIFTSDLLEQIRLDMKQTSLPSWAGRPPHNFGSKSHGKLSADQWRTICSVNLVITMVRYWTKEGTTDRQRSLLNNFLDLVIAVDLLTRRSTSPERIDLYERYMKRYVSDIQELFEEDVRPNHHLSLHLGEVGTGYGPIRGLWAFVFERYLGILRGYNTNSKPGEMELTLLRYFCMTGNLRAFIQSWELPDDLIYQEFGDYFKDAFGDLMRGDEHHLQDASKLQYKYDHSKEKTLPDVIYTELLNCINADLDEHQQMASWTSLGSSSLLSPRCQPIPSIDHLGVKYMAARRSYPNSMVVFVDPSSRDVRRAGQIVDLFVHQRRVSTGLVAQPFVVVREFMPLTPEDKHHDPYRKIENLGVHLCYRRFEEGHHVLKPRSLVSHFASMIYTPEGIDQECIIIRSLDRSYSASHDRNGQPRWFPKDKGADILEEYLVGDAAACTRPHYHYLLTAFVMPLSDIFLVLGAGTSPSSAQPRCQSARFTRGRATNFMEATGSQQTKVRALSHRQVTFG